MGELSWDFSVARDCLILMHSGPNLDDAELEIPDPPDDLPELRVTGTQAPAEPATPESEGEASTQQGRRQATGIALTVLADAKLLNPPVRLFRNYKGHAMEASLLPSGEVEFQGKRYPSSSTAAEVARATVTGRKMPTNGWSFWQVQGESGKRQTLGQIRDAYAKRG